MGISVVARLRDEHMALPFGILVMAFSDEEGTRFGKELLGSSAFAGVWDDAWWEMATAYESLNELDGGISVTADPPRGWAPHRA